MSVLLFVAVVGQLSYVNVKKLKIQLKPNELSIWVFVCDVMGSAMSMISLILFNHLFRETLSENKSDT